MITIDLSSTGLYSDVRYFLEGINDEGLRDRLASICREYEEKYKQIFTDKFFDEELSEREGLCRRGMIYPAMRVIFYKFYVDPPPIFTSYSLESDKFTNSNPDRLRLFQEQFNLGEFLLYLKDKMIKNIHCLDDFENLSPETELISLIISNYVALKVKYVQNFRGSINREVRDLKINKIL